MRRSGADADLLTHPQTKKVGRSNAETGTLEGEMPPVDSAGGRFMLGNAVPSLLQHIRHLAATASSDEQLLADFLAQRSDEAFAALLGRHGPMVLNVCRRILHDAHAAEDVFQATFLVLAERACAIRRRASLAGFLHGVAYRLAVRARQRRLQGLPAAVCDQAVGPPEELAWKEMLGILDHELGLLSDRYRAPLVLCYLEGRTQDEASRQLGWSLNTLRRRLAQGRRLLEARLRGRGVTLSAALAGLLAARAVAVPGPLRAATLAAVGARAAEGLTAGATVFSSVGKGITRLLSTSSKKGGPLVAVAVLGAAICFGYGWAPPQKEAGGTRMEESALTNSALRLPPASFGTALYRHGSRIESLAVSADGRLAAAASGWGAFAPARLFDLTDGRCLYSLPNERGPYTEAVGLSPDGKTLATKDDKDLCLRDAATGKELRKIRYLPASGGGRPVTDWLMFTPDGKQIAATLIGDAVCLIDVETGAVTRTFAHAAAVSACVFSPDGKLMATGGYEQEKRVYFARLWEVGTGKELRRFPAGDGRVRALAFAPDGATLAGGGWGDGRLRLWETATGRELQVFPRIGSDIEGVAFAPDGRTVAAAGDNVYLYDPATGKERLRIERRAQRLAFSQDGAVLTSAVSGAIYRWDAASGRQLTPSAAQDCAVEQVLVTADGRTLFTTDLDGNLYVWDSVGGKSPRRIVGGIERGVVASPDGRFLAWVVPDESVRTAPPRRVRGTHIGSRVRLYDVAGQQVIDRFPGFAEDAAVAAFLPDGQTLLTVGGGVATVRLWDVASGKERRSFPVSPKLDANVPDSARWAFLRWTTRRAALAPDGKTLAIGLDWGENLRTERRGVPVQLWDLATGKARHDLNEPLNAMRVADEAGAGTTDMSRAAFNRKMKSTDGRAFSPDGRFLVDWAENPFGRSRMDHVSIWDAETGRAVATLDAGPRPGAANAAFAPDGRTLATASADGTVRLWEVATWKVRVEFRGHRDRVTALAFGPDGRLFSGGLDTVIRAWDVQPPRDTAKATLASAWEALADADAKMGFQAQGRFLTEPAKAVDWIAARVPPVSLLDPSRVQALIADLDKDDFATRERATAALREHAAVAAAALRDVVAKSSSAEARRRAEHLLRELEMANAVPPLRELRALRALEVLEWIATKEARACLLELTKGAPDARLTHEATAACKRLAGRTMER
jgi:RNA polymerase sigma factor (sigma-70 family)